MRLQQIYQPSLLALLSANVQRCIENISTQTASQLLTQIHAQKPIYTHSAHPLFLYPLCNEMFILQSKLPSCVPTAPPALLNTHKTVIIHPIYTHAQREGEKRNGDGGRTRVIHMGMKECVYGEIEGGWVKSRSIKLRNQVQLWDQFKWKPCVVQFWGIAWP